MEDLLAIAGNVILAPILLWFMKQNSGLIKSLIDKQQESTKVIATNTEVIKEHRRTMEHVADVIVKCEQK